MKTIAIRCGLAAAFLTSAAAADACDLCAVYTAGMAHGETSGWYAGIFEQLTRYDELREDGHKIPDSSGQYLDSSITQLFVGYGATDRLSLQLNVPYIYRKFKRPEGDAIEHGTESGLGDITALAQYTLLRHDDEDETWVWRALGGIKFGTGDSDRLKEELDEGADGAPKHGGHDGGAISGIHGHDLALGSGSTDFLVGTSGFYRSGRWYGEANLQYAIRRTGDFDYRFGNDLQWVLSAGRYLVLEHDRTVSLQLNLSGEDKDYDEANGVRADDTQSRVLFLGPQMGFTFGPRWSLELRADFPVHVENSAIQTTVGWRGQAAFVGKF
jgi:outer membrane putative beta-barrel porin/alpha-amylase